MKKIVKILICFVAVSLVLVGCGKKVDTEKTELYSKKAEEVIELLNDGKKEELTNQFNAEMKEAMTDESFATVDEEIKKAGDFEKIEKVSVQEKDNIYSTVTIAKYSNEKRVFTISFNSDNKIAGLFIK